MPSPVPVHVFTGFFGTGKTTCIAHLLQAKRPKESWAVLVNEFGEIGLDGAYLSEAEATGGVTIVEIPGGCLCCAQDVPLETAVEQILERAHPDRLLIEPTGIGHPAGIADALHAPRIVSRAQLRSVICLVDPRHVGDDRIEQVGIYQDQISIADILIANKSDLANQSDLVRFHDWAANLFPPKSDILTSVRGAIDPGLLDRNYHRTGNAEPAGRAQETSHAHRSGEIGSRPQAERGTVRRENASADALSCGWIFPPDRRFDRGAVVDLLASPDLAGSAAPGSVLRLKAVIRVKDEWLKFDRVRSECSCGPIAYRRDSRIEVILAPGQTPDWDRLESRLDAIAG